MANDERQSTRSSSTPSRTGSYRDGPISKPTDHPYQRRSSVIEENDKEDEYEDRLNDGTGRVSDRPPPRSEDQYIAALRHRFPNRPKSDYAYSSPPGPLNPTPLAPTTTTQPTTRTTTTTATTTTPSSGPYQSTLRPPIGGANAQDTTDNRTFPKPALRRVSPDQQNTYARRVLDETTTPTSPSRPSPITPGGTVRINDPASTTNIRTTSTTQPQSGISRPQESIFESVPSHGGPVSYLGTGTFSQFEHCLRECLERERRHLGFESHITRHDYPSAISAHDYGYDHDPFIPSTSSHPLLHSIDDHHLVDYPSVHAPTFVLDDIRNINVALSRSGISLFPYQRPFFGSYPSSISLPSTTIHSTYPGERRIIGEVVSACRLVEEDSSLLYDRSRTRAVQNVWNAIRHHEPFSFTDPSRPTIFPMGPYDI